jgi:hypothetical protein
MPEHIDITDPNIHEPKGIGAALAGTVYVANGSGSGSWSSSPFNLQETNVLLTSSNIDQSPTAVDTPLQISLGPPTDSTAYFDVSSTGTITCLQDGNYFISFFGRFGRTTSVGVSILHARFLLNDVQVRATTSEKLDDGNFSIPYRASILVTLSQNDTIKIELSTDSAGVDSGGFLTENLSASLIGQGWISPAPSAAVSIDLLEVK